jgi:hypothetical protein
VRNGGGGAQRTTGERERERERDPDDDEWIASDAVGAARLVLVGRFDVRFSILMGQPTRGPGPQRRKLLNGPTG